MAATESKKRAVTGNGKVYYSVIGEDGSYGEVKEFGPLVETSVKENNTTSQAEAGDQVYLQATEYGGTDVTFGVYDITKQAQCDVYGHTLSSTGGLVKNSKDKVPYIALMIEGHAQTETAKVTDYITLYKGMLQAPEIKTKTKSKGTTEFQYYSISGTFQDNDEGLHQYIQSSDDAGFDEETWKTTWGKTVPVPTAATTDV